MLNGKRRFLANNLEEKPRKPTSSHYTNRSRDYYEDDFDNSNDYSRYVPNKQHTQAKAAKNTKIQYQSQDDDSYNQQSHLPVHRSHSPTKGSPDKYKLPNQNLPTIVRNKEIPRNSNQQRNHHVYTIEIEDMIAEMQANPSSKQNIFQKSPLNARQNKFENEIDLNKEIDSVLAKSKQSTNKRTMSTPKKSKQSNVSDNNNYIYSPPADKTRTKTSSYRNNPPPPKADPRIDNNYSSFEKHVDRSKINHGKRYSHANMNEQSSSTDSDYYDEIPQQVKFKRKEINYKSHSFISQQDDSEYSEQETFHKSPRYKIKPKQVTPPRTRNAELPRKRVYTNQEVSDDEYSDDIEIPNSLKHTPNWLRPTPPTNTKPRHAEGLLVKHKDNQRLPKVDSISSINNESYKINMPQHRNYNRKVDYSDQYSYSSDNDTSRSPYINHSSFIKQVSPRAPLFNQKPKAKPKFTRISAKQGSSTNSRSQTHEQEQPKTAVYSDDEENSQHISASYRKTPITSKSNISTEIFNKSPVSNPKYLLGAPVNKYISKRNNISYDEPVDKPRITRKQVTQRSEFSQLSQTEIPSSQFSPKIDKSGKESFDLNEDSNSSSETNLIFDKENLFNNRKPFNRYNQEEEYEKPPDDIIQPTQLLTANQAGMRRIRNQKSPLKIEEVHAFEFFPPEPEEEAPSYPPINTEGFDQHTLEMDDMFSTLDSSDSEEPLQLNRKINKTRSLDEFLTIEEQTKEAIEDDISNHSTTSDDPLASPVQEEQPHKEIKNQEGQSTEEIKDKVNHSNDETKDHEEEDNDDSFFYWADDTKPTNAQHSLFNSDADELINNILNEKFETPKIKTNKKDSQPEENKDNKPIQEDLIVINNDNDDTKEESVVKIEEEEEEEIFEGETENEIPISNHKGEEEQKDLLLIDLNPTNEEKLDIEPEINDLTDDQNLTTESELIDQEIANNQKEELNEELIELNSDNSKTEINDESKSKSFEKEFTNNCEKEQSLDLIDEESNYSDNLIEPKTDLLVEEQKIEQLEEEPNIDLFEEECKTEILYEEPKAELFSEVEHSNENLEEEQNIDPLKESIDEAFEENQPPETFDEDTNNDFEDELNLDEELKSEKDIDDKLNLIEDKLGENNNEDLNQSNEEKEENQITDNNQSFEQSDEQDSKSNVSIDLLSSIEETKEEVPETKETQNKEDNINLEDINEGSNIDFNQFLEEDFKEQEQDQENLNQFLNLDPPKDEDINHTEDLEEDIEAQQKLLLEYLMPPNNKPKRKRKKLNIEKPPESPVEKGFMFVALEPDPIKKKKKVQQVPIINNFSKVMMLIQKYLGGSDEIRNVKLILPKHRHRRLVLVISPDSSSLLGIYVMTKSMSEIRRVWGSSPEIIRPSDVTDYFAFDIISKALRPLSTTSFTQDVDSIFVK